MLPLPGRRRGSSILSLLRGGSGLSALGELADERRLGELPTEDDLRAILVDPLGPSQAGESSGSRAAAAAAAGAGGWQPAGSGATADLHPAIFFQQAGWVGGLQGHGSASATYRLASPAALPAQQVQQVPSAALEGGPAPGGTARRRGAGLAKLKRRLDRLEAEAQQEGSPRKRHSGEAAWSGSLGGSDSEGSSEEGRRSSSHHSMPREPGGWPWQAVRCPWFSGRAHKMGRKFAGVTQQGSWAVRLDRGSQLTRADCSASMPCMRAAHMHAACAQAARANPSLLHASQAACCALPCCRAAALCSRRRRRPLKVPARGPLSAAAAAAAGSAH